MRNISSVVPFLLTYMIYGLCRLLGVKRSCWLLSGLGKFLGKVSPKSKKAKQRLGKAFPYLSDEEKNSFIQKMWENLGAVVAEYANIDRIKVGTEHLIVEGAEHLERLKNDGQPGIIFAAHLANWEMVSVACLHYGLKISQVYRAANNPLVNRLIRKLQQRITKQLIPKGVTGGKKSLESLDRGEHLILLVDQKMNNGISVPFFGREAMTAAGLAKLAEKYQCPVLPAQVARLDSGQLKVIFHPEIYFKPSDSPDRHRLFMMEVHAYLEQWISQNPGQWLWVHNRWNQ